jgi:hypothetical protein
VSFRSHVFPSSPGPVAVSAFPCSTIWSKPRSRWLHPDPPHQAALGTRGSSGPGHGPRPVVRQLPRHGPQEENHRDVHRGDKSPYRNRGGLRRAASAADRAQGPVRPDELLPDERKPPAEWGRSEKTTPLAVMSSRRPHYCRDKVLSSTRLPGAVSPALYAYVRTRTTSRKNAPRRSPSRVSKTRGLRVSNR